MVSPTFKNRTREEVIAAVRQSIQRKREWEEQAQIEFAEMRRNQLTVAL